MKTKDLRLADVVEVKQGYYNTATVKQIKDGMVTFFRPYVKTEDFSYTGGVICYIGIEEFSVSQDSEQEWVLLDRKELK